MSEHKHYKIDVVKVPKKWKAKAFIDKDAYGKLYRKSVEKPDKFWGKEGKRLDWIKPYTIVKNTSFAYPDVSIKWFEDGTLNVAANCIDRHLKKRGKQVAIILEPDDPNGRSQAHHLSRAAPTRVPPGQCAQGQRGQARRPGHDLSADDPGSGLRHAGLRPHRGGALGGVRRLLARLAGGAHRGLQIEIPDHRRRGPARRP